MKIFLALFVLITFYVNTQAQNQMENLNTIIQNVKDKFAPDKRTALFNIEAIENENGIVIKGETNLPEAKAELDKDLKQAKINFTDNIELLPSEKLNGKIYGVINLSVANCRSKPDHPAELVTQSIMGTPVKVLKKGQDGYYLVQTPDGYISWLDDDGVQFMDKNEFNSWISSDKVIYTANYGLCYSNPDDKSQTVSDLVAGNILKYLGDEQNYYKVEYPDKRIGYIKKDDAKLFNDWYKSLNPKANDILNTAYRFMGTPYLWGGTSTKGMDCSGFTKTVFFLNGIVLNRDASQQVNFGELVNTDNGWENLQPGDLLFFGFRGTPEKKERITHVAIYIGDGDFIHDAGRVRINSFNPSKSYYSDYRKSGFIRAKRYLGSIGNSGIEKIMDNSFYKIQ